MSIRSELLNIQHATTDNVLHAVDVVEWAKDNPDSALHHAIEWNDTRAAHEFRLSQVRHLIQLHIIDDKGEPEMVSLTVDRVAGGGYRSIRDVVAIPDLRQIMLQDALAELQQKQQKYARVQELKEVWEAVDRAREEEERARIASASSQKKGRARARVSA